MKKTIWLFAMAVALAIFLFSPLVGFELVFFIDAIGFDMFAMLIEVQLLVTISVYGNKIKHAFKLFNDCLMEQDANYFIPSCTMIKDYPPILIHAVPGLVVLPAMVFLIITMRVIQLT